MPTMIGLDGRSLALVAVTVIALTSCRQMGGSIPTATTTVSSQSSTVRSLGTADLEQRPITLTPLNVGKSCPISVARSAGGFNVVGDGPIYLVQPSTVHYGKGVLQNGWHYIKAPWLSSPNYRGTALIRGRQLDGQNELRFQRGGPESTAGLPYLQFPVNTGISSPDLQTAWRFQSASLGFGAPGCYGIQVDASGFAETIVIEAKE